MIRCGAYGSTAAVGMNLALLEQAAASPKNTVKAVLDPRPSLCCVALVHNEQRSKRKRIGRT